MNIAPIKTVKEVLKPYDATKDIEFVTVDKIVNCKATPANFFIFFPGDAHRPGLKDGVNSPVRKGCHEGEGGLKGVRRMRREEEEHGTP